MDELARLDGLGQARLVASGRCSPLELVEAAIERIERVDPQLGAVIVRLFDRARAEAASPALPRGPFRGVPILLKDLGCPVAGVTTFAGTRFLRDRGWRAPADAALATRLRAAGFVLVGRTNTPELGLSPTTEPESFGPTRNPWDPERIVGGSSGGSAAAVAAGLVPIAHAGDGGGSIRNPAGACGVVGLKPSRGRVSLGPALGEGWAGCLTEFAITRSVRDAAALLDCVAGPTNGDPYFAPPPARPYADEVASEPARLRIGLFTHHAGRAPHAEALAAVANAARLLEALGHDVEDAHPAALDEPGWGDAAAAVVAASTAHEIDAIERATGERVREEDVEPATWAIAERGRAIPAVDHLRTVEELHAFSRRLRSFWRELPGEEGFDALLTPSMAEPAPRIGSLRGAGVERILGLVPYTMPYNVSGQPAISLPLHWSREGLPLGVQIVARYGGEDLLLRLASQLEQAQPWRERRPPIHA
jgi:amidase